MEKPERRHFSRIDLDAPVVIEHDRQRWETKLEDISLKGLLVKRPDNWGNDIQNYNVVVHLPEQNICMQTQLAHVEADAIGFTCVAIDLDSAATLRRVVELNLGDEQLLQRELSAMLA